MGRKNKKKTKKVNVKRERYAKFRKEKPSAMSFTTPDISIEQRKYAQDDDKKISIFLKTHRNKPAKEIVERKMKSKR
jgi:hypothetical protein